MEERGEEETFKDKLYRYEKLDKDISRLQKQMKRLKEDRKQLGEEIKQHMNDNEVDEVDLKSSDSVIMKEEKRQRKPLPKKAVESRIQDAVKDDPETLKKINDILQEREEVNTLKLKRQTL